MPTCANCGTEMTELESKPDWIPDTDDEEIDRTWYQCSNCGQIFGEVVVEE